MDLGHPLRSIAPTVDADVLTVLAQGDIARTGREVHRATGNRSQEGVRRTLERLVQSGIVLRSAAGRSHLYSLNHDHVLAGAIVSIVHSRTLLVDRLRAHVAAWGHQPNLAAIFGSFATGDASSTSDLDIVVVRPDGASSADDGAWMDQIDHLRDTIVRWTGNEARIIELTEADLAPPFAHDLVEDIARQGIELVGSMAALRRAARRS